jgi:hypothetical protein
MVAISNGCKPGWQRQIKAVSVYESRIASRRGGFRQWSSAKVIHSVRIPFTLWQLMWKAYTFLADDTKADRCHFAPREQSLGRGKWVDGQQHSSTNLSAGTVMTISKREKDALIAAEIAQSEATRDKALPADAGVRRNRSPVYSLRLAPKDVARIEELAIRSGVPASSLVRGWIQAAMADENPADVAGAVARLELDVARLKGLVA